MLEPWQEMAAAVGDVAMLAPVAEPMPVGTTTPTDPPAALETMTAPPRRTAEQSNTVRPGSDSEPAAEAPVPANPPSGIDFSDLSIIDPVLIAPSVLPPASSGGGSSAGGGSSGSVPSSLAGQSTADGAAVFSGLQANNDGGHSPADSPTTRGSVETGVIASGSAAPAPPTAALRGPAGPPELFVTPPNDAPPIEGPAPSAGPPVASLMSSSPIFAVGTDAGVTGQVKVYDAATLDLKFTLSPFANSFTGGVRVAVADVTGDGTADIITAQGPGGANRVKVFNGQSGNQLGGALGSFIPFDTNQADGVFVAAGDVNADGRADVIVGSDGDGKPRAKIVNGQNGNTIRNIQLSDLNLAGGVRVGAGDVNGDGRADALVAGGPGGAARVAAFDGGNGMHLYDFFPFEAGYTGGVDVAAGDVTGDGFADLIVGQTSGASAVRIFDGEDTSTVWNFDAFPEFTGGVRIGAVDADQDGRLDVLAGQGPGGDQVRLFRLANADPLASVVPFNAFTGGLFVAGDARPAEGGGGILSVDPVVSITASAGAIEGGTVSFTITRTGETTADLFVDYGLGGTASGMSDFSAFVDGPLTIPSGSASLVYTVETNDDSIFEGPETAAMVLIAGTGYELGTPSTVGRGPR